MANLWHTKEVPHKVWNLVDVIDITEDGQPEEDAPYETCMMCNHEKIRYIHIVDHKDYPQQIRVGCNCAEKLTEDYTNPAAKEKELRSRSSRLKTWYIRKWKTSAKGNIEGHNITIFKNNSTGKFTVKIDESYGRKEFETLRDAQTAAFKGREYYKKKGDW
jgi:hypothetical protein